MRILELVMYLFHRYYATGPTQRIPYFSALTAVAFSLFLHIFQLLIIVRKVDWLGIQTHDPQPLKYLKMTGILVPLYLIVFFAVPPAKIKDLTYDEVVIARGNRWLVAYVVCNIILLFTLIIIFVKPV